MINEAILY